MLSRSIRSKLLPAALAGATLLATLTGAQAQDNAVESITVVVPTASAISNFPLWVAKGEGYFADEGLDVTVQVVDGSAASIQVLTSGQAEIGHAGPSLVLQAQERGVDVVAFYNLNPNSVFGVIVEGDSGYTDVAQLEGKIIGVGTADGAEVPFFNGIMRSIGLVEGEDYELLVVGDGGLAAVGFTRGDIDAYVASTSDASIMRARGIDVSNITPAAFRTQFGNGFVTLRETLDSNPELIERFGRALVRAAIFAQDPANEDAVLAHAAVGNPQEGEDREFASALFETILERGTPLDLSNGWGYFPREGWEFWQETELANGGLSAPLDNLDAAFTTDFVQAWNAQ